MSYPTDRPVAIVMLPTDGAALAQIIDAIDGPVLIEPIPSVTLGDVIYYNVIIIRKKP